MKTTKTQLRKLIRETINKLQGNIPFDTPTKFAQSNVPNDAIYAQINVSRLGNPESIYFLDIDKKPLKGGINLKALVNIRSSNLPDVLSEINSFVLEYASEPFQFDPHTNYQYIQGILSFGLLGLTLEDSNIFVIDYDAIDIMMMTGMMKGETSNEIKELSLDSYLKYITEHLKLMREN
jgi:hypothetical protein